MRKTEISDSDVPLFSSAFALQLTRVQLKQSAVTGHLAAYSHARCMSAACTRGDTCIHLDVAQIASIIKIAKNARQCSAEVRRKHVREDEKDQE